MAKYNMKLINFFLKDPKLRDYLLDNNDYLLNMQATLKLVEKELLKSKANILITNLLTNLLDDLTYVNKHYSLVKLNKKKSAKTPKGKEISQ
jgi:hypothetical protein